MGVCAGGSQPYPELLLWDFTCDHVFCGLLLMDSGVVLQTDFRWMECFWEAVVILFSGVVFFTVVPMVGVSFCEPLEYPESSLQPGFVPPCPDELPGTTVCRSAISTPPIPVCHLACPKRSSIRVGGMSCVCGM